MFGAKGWKIVRQDNFMREGIWANAGLTAR